MEERRSEIQERQRTLEEAIRTSDGAIRDEAEQRLAETTEELLNLEESLQWDARRDAIPKLLTEMLDRKQGLQEALRNRDDKEQTKETGLLAGIKQRLPELKGLLGKINDHWGCEDHVYRFYHESFKVFGLQELTLKVVDSLIGLAPHDYLNSSFVKIVIEGTGREFTMEMNKRWAENTRPILEAFFHARYFLEMVCKYGEELHEPPQRLPSGWAAVLALYGLR